MAFFQRLLASQCAHRFTWPRVDNNGRHYQICVACGISYLYDWNKMRRTNRLMLPALDPTPSATDPRRRPT
jgi:hypothetical protein